MKKIILIITMLVASTSIFAQLDSAYFNRTGLSPRSPYGWFDKGLYVGNWGNRVLSAKDTVYNLTNAALSQIRANQLFVKKWEPWYGRFVVHKVAIDTPFWNITFLATDGAKGRLLMETNSKVTGTVSQGRILIINKNTNTISASRHALFEMASLRIDTTGVELPSGAGDIFGVIGFRGKNTSNAGTMLGGIQVYTPDGLRSVTSFGSYPVNAGANTNLNRLFAIHSSKNVVIADDADSDNGAARLQVQGNVAPITNNTSTSGTISYRWSNIFSVAGNYTGTVEANSFVKTGGTASQLLAANGSVITAGANITISGGVISASGGGGSTLATATGDASGTVSGSNLPLTLATVNSNVGTYGGATNIPIITANAKGLVTALATTSIPVLATGTYTPTLSSLANCTSATASVAQWMQLGNVVTVSGSIQLTPANTTSVFLLYMSIPVVANFLAASSKAGGVASRSNGNTSIACIGAINADSAGSQNVIVTFSKAEAATADTYYYTYTYRIN